MNGKTIQQQPRDVMIADAVFSHLAHHRGQLTVYLRMCHLQYPRFTGHPPTNSSDRASGPGPAARQSPRPLFLLNSVSYDPRKSPGRGSRLSARDRSPPATCWCGFFAIRTSAPSGSGNIGATNVLRSGGKGLGAATFLLDVLKGICGLLALALCWRRPSFRPRRAQCGGSGRALSPSSATCSRSGFAFAAAKASPRDLAFSWSPRRWPHLLLLRSSPRLRAQPLVSLARSWARPASRSSPGSSSGAKAGFLHRRAGNGRALIIVKHHHNIRRLSPAPNPASELPKPHDIPPSAPHRRAWFRRVGNRPRALSLPRMGTQSPSGHTAPRRPGRSSSRRKHAQFLPGFPPPPDHRDRRQCAPSAHADIVVSVVPSEFLRPPWRGFARTCTTVRSSSAPPRAWRTTPSCA